jgi:hypothetical protein
MIHLLLLASLLCFNINAMHQQNTKKLQLEPFGTSDFTQFARGAREEHTRNELIIKSQQKELNRDLLHLEIGLMPKNLEQFAELYIQRKLVPAMHTETFGTVGQEIQKYGDEIQSAILNSTRFPKIKPYLLLATSNDGRAAILTTQFFRGDRSACNLFEKLPCIQALQGLSAYEGKIKPHSLSSADIWRMPHHQLQLCDYIEKTIKNAPILPITIPLSRFQEKELCTLPSRVIKKVIGHHALACQQPITDTLWQAVGQTWRQREIISSASSRAWGLFAVYQVMMGYDDISIGRLQSLGLSIGTGNFLLHSPLLMFAIFAQNRETTITTTVGIIEMLAPALIIQPITEPSLSLLGNFVPMATTIVATHNTYTALTAHSTIKTIDEIKPKKMKKSKNKKIALTQNEPENL